PTGLLYRAGCFVFVYSHLIYNFYLSIFSFLFFFKHSSTTEIYTLSLQTLFRSHARANRANLRIGQLLRHRAQPILVERLKVGLEDRKSTRLNSSHEWISYAVFCLKKKKNATCARSTVALRDHSAVVHHSYARAR